MIELIYALHTEGVMFYVGRTNNLLRRYNEHINSANENGTLKEKVIRQLLQEGQKIEIKVLESGSAEHLQGKEDLWVTKLRSDGHPLTNSRSGDSPLLKYEPQQSKPWSVELFAEATWTKTATCKAGEVAADIKSLTFYRLGKRKFRFERVGLGSWDVLVPKASPIHFYYEKAILMLSPGTAENAFWESQVARHLRHRGK